jgi:C4-dicarboxylate-specific signal transduction histidine kinase
LTTEEELKKENYQLKEEIKQLKNKISEEVEKSRINDKVLFQQSKMASMGEMIGNIAHQWRQPLMELSSIFMVIQSKIEFEGKIKESELLNYLKKSESITQYMSQTIDDFRDFFAKEKEKANYRISNQVSLAVSMVNMCLKQHDIKVEIIIKKNPKIYGFKNEYSQVLINVLNNSKDALIDRKIENPKIKIIIDKKDDNSVLIIEDNAGGISVNPVEKIFEPFFTVDKKNGTGIGLFMSKIIVENNMNGRLFVENIEKGARFIITVPLVH